MRQTTIVVADAKPKGRLAPYETLDIPAQIISHRFDLGNDSPRHFR